MRGLVGEGAELNLDHLDEVRDSTVLFHLTKHLLYHTYRDANAPPKLHLFGQMKRIARQWLDGGYLDCKAGTKPAQLLYLELTERAANKIKAAITETLIGERTIKAILDAYNPTGSTRFVNFTTSKPRFAPRPDRCHLNWIVADSDWERDFANIAENHPRVLAYVKNQALGFEVPYLLGTFAKRYRPDFILRVDDGRPGPLNLIVEVKGFRGEDAKEKANTMNAFWVPGVNNLGAFGRWAFAEFRAIHDMKAEFEKLIAQVAVREAELA